ncbi:MAG: glycosyltransferase [Kiritimatiellae bacterium]|nr:glycosyltransferase [Kiritimatiellia bacterium]
MSSGEFRLEEALQVVLITYNRERALRHTLGRLFAPDSPVRGCGITVLDNASDDGTRRTALGFAAEHPNLKVVTHPRNIGGNANIVRAFESASREYLWVLCDDDDFDWSRWRPVGGALASGEYDMVYTVNALNRPSETPDAGYLAFLAAFVPGCIYRASLIDGDVLQNMYAMIHTWYPQCVPALHALCNLGRPYFLPPANVVLRRLLTDDGVREMTMAENDATLTRGMGAAMRHPDLTRMFWHVGFARAAQIVADEKKRALVIEGARFNESWSADFLDYCEYVYEYNRDHRGGSARNLADFMFDLPRNRRFPFAMIVLRPYLPLYLEVRRGRVELVVLRKLKLRLWDRRWFGGKGGR